MLVSFFPELPHALVALLALLAGAAAYDPRAALLLVVATFPLLQLQFPADPERYMLAQRLELCMWALSIGWLSRIARGRAPAPSLHPGDRWMGLLIALALGSAVAVLLARHCLEGLAFEELAPTAVASAAPLAPGFPAHQALVVIEGVLWYWLVRTVLCPSDIRAFAIAAVIGVLLSAAFGVYVYYRYNVHFPYSGKVRATSLFAGPNNYATYLILSLPLVWQLSRASKVWILALIPAAAMLALTRSEGAWLGLGVALCWARCWELAPSVRRLLAGAALVLLGGVLVLAMRWLDAEQLNRISDGRYYLFRAGVEMVREAPWTGVGIGNFFSLLSVFYPEGIAGRAVHEHAHNLYLQVAAELGLPGLLVLVVPIWSALRRAAKLGRDPLARGLALGLAAVFAHSITDFTLFSAALWLYTWTWLAVLAVVLQPKARHASEQDRVTKQE